MNKMRVIQEKHVFLAAIHSMPVLGIHIYIKEKTVILEKLY